MAKVKTIKVCGDKPADRLYDMCSDYLRAINSPHDKQEITFEIKLDNGEIKHITFQEKNSGIFVHGDFNELKKGGEK